MSRNGYRRWTLNMWCALAIVVLVFWAYASGVAGN